MSYEADLNDYIGRVNGLLLSAKSAITAGISTDRLTLIQSVQEHTAQAKETLDKNKNTLINAYQAADAAGKLKLAADLKEMSDEIDAAKHEFRKLIGG